MRDFALKKCLGVENGGIQSKVAQVLLAEISCQARDYFLRQPKRTILRNSHRKTSRAESLEPPLLCGRIQGHHGSQNLSGPERIEPRYQAAGFALVQMEVARQVSQSAGGVRKGASVAEPTVQASSEGQNEPSSPTEPYQARAGRHVLAADQRSVRQPQVAHVSRNEIRIPLALQSAHKTMQAEASRVGVGENG